MNQWDAPARGRAFLAAALLTAVCGMLFSVQDTTPRLAATSAGPRPSLTQPAMSSASDAAASAGTVDSDLAEAGALPGPEERAELRDAVALAPSPTLAAGPAAASGAWLGASRAAVGPRGEAPSGAAARQAAERLAGPGAKVPTPFRGDSTIGSSDSASQAASATLTRRTSSPASFMEPARGLASRERRPASAAGPSGQLPPGGGSASASGPSAAVSASPSAPAASDAGSEASRRLSSLKPVLLSTLLGPHPLRPPMAAIKPPADNPWKKGSPVPGVAPMTNAQAEAAAPPEKSPRRGPIPLERDGAAGWLERHEGRWWLWPSPGGPALLWHENHWWWQSRGVWFLLHEGQPWGWRYLREWRQEGLVHASGAQMIYSADGRRVGVVAPGQGAALYDARTGAALGRWSAEQLPRPRAYKIPARLNLP